MARQERKYHYIYKIICNITNRFYIGMHSTDNLEDGYFGSGKRLWFSINYYGKENHIKEIVEFLSTRQLLKEREKEIVNKELLGDVMCMNLKEGGDGGFINKEHMMKCSNAGNEKHKQRFIDDEEHRFKVLEILKKGRENINKLGVEFYNRSGKKHSDETKNKIREKIKNKHLGETNSQYGTCWITKEGINKKIKKEDLDKWIKDNWSKGRIVK